MSVRFLLDKKVGVQVIPQLVSFSRRHLQLFAYPGLFQQFGQVEKQEGNGPLDQRATMVSNCCMEGDLVEEGELWGKVFRN